MLGKLEECLQLLIESNRIPEAALMARSYLPSKVPEIVALWKKDLQKVNSKAAESLADPDEYPNLFEDWQIALNVEAAVAPKRGIYPPAEEYTIHAERSNESLVEAFKNMHVHEEEDAHEEDVHDEEELTNENDTVHEVFEDDGVEDSQEDAVEVDADGSTDGTIHVNGNDSEEQWGTNKEEPSA
jgi:coatomer subunit beta'